MVYKIIEIVNHDTCPTILHGRVCYILEADSKRPVDKKDGCTITEKKDYISSELNTLLRVQIKNYLLKTGIL